jgi:tRNA nucleotidyltransferase (CCA-adding enzyme)
MQCYLVGGAVRDQLLGLPVRERDWVVVGTTAETLLAQGYTPVGRDFPVFLHPTTHAEYALARTERKAAQGHRGFVCQATPQITLEQDLQRRDLTLNAIAQAHDGTLIDPYGGQTDLQQRWLRHVSPAFTEDPLRVLRVARFAACYAAFDFRIAPETMALMQWMVTHGELQHLTPERVWKETAKALCSAAPQRYFTVLQECHALPGLFPELADLFGVPTQSAGQHSVIDSGLETLQALEQSAQLSDDLAVRCAVICRAFGKARTPKAYWPAHPDHELEAAPLIQAFCTRLRVPNHPRELALLVATVAPLIQQAPQLKPECLLKLLMTLDVWRRPQRLTQVLLACQSWGTSTQCHKAMFPAADYLVRCFEALSAVNFHDLKQAEYSGATRQKIVWQRRLQVLQRLS